MTAEHCPMRTEAVCALSALEARDVTKSCDETTLGNCVQTYYEMTYEKELSNADYCR